MKTGGSGGMDLGRDQVGVLFTRLFFPTLFGLLCSAALNLADGIFVGRGCGPAALAAVNIAAPIFLVVTGVALLFGTGSSILGAIFLARGKLLACSVTVTQALLAPALPMLALGIAMLITPGTFCRLFGGSEALAPLVADYLTFLCPLPLLMGLAIVGMFAIRLDGSPRYAMLVNIVPSLLNIFLDWLFIFPLGMGLQGAALATSLAEVSAVALVLLYPLLFQGSIRPCRLQVSWHGLLIALRNTCCMVRAGFPTFIGETALCCMMIAGNFMFMRLLGEDGVAAYSVACYLFPLVFMFANSIFQAALPIISYNLGARAPARISATLRLGMGLALASGLALTAAGLLGSGAIVGIFLSPQSAAFGIAERGLPWFSLSFACFSLNIVAIGYYQSMGCHGRATTLMLLRGALLIVPIFLTLPLALGELGLWLSVPLSEGLTLAAIAFLMLFRGERRPELLMRRAN
ncbi:MAG: hypothetical protein K6A65_04135 [Succinivibrionaceae bacterium]|nr:hypothetical protein [Succinivibrionaceae bacterium]